LDLLEDLVAELDKIPELDEDNFLEGVADILRNNLQIQDDVEVYIRLQIVLEDLLRNLGWDTQDLQDLHGTQRIVVEDKMGEYFED